MPLPLPCAFCQRSGVKMSREHVLPHWLSLAGSDAGQYILERDSKTIRTPLIELVTKRVCEDCNTGWMSRIEDGAKAVLEPVLDASAMAITETDRWIIARWFTKTILTAQLALTARSENGILHPQDYSTFFSHAQPFNNQFTLLWGYQGPLLPIRFEIHSPNEATNQGVRVFFHFHRIILLLISWRWKSLATLSFHTDSLTDATFFGQVSAGFWALETLRFRSDGHRHIWSMRPGWMPFAPRSNLLIRRDLRAHPLPLIEWMTCWNAIQRCAGICGVERCCEAKVRPGGPGEARQARHRLTVKPQLIADLRHHVKPLPQGEGGRASHQKW
jgi:hypothetical protein